MPRKPLELGPEQLRRVCDPSELGFQTTEEIGPVIGTVGQDRALNALDFGLDIATVGYNLYIAGVPGTGRSTTVKSRVGRVSKERPTPGDWCYVHNFADPYRPQAIGLPAGMAPAFGRDMETLVEICRREIPAAFQGEGYQQRRQQIMNELDRRREQLYRALDEQARRLGLTVQVGPAGIMTVPLKDGKPMDAEEFQQLSQEERDRYRDASEGLQDEMMTFMLGMRDTEQAAVERVRGLDRELALGASEHHIRERQERYSFNPKIVAHLEAVQNDMVEHLEQFRPQQETPGQGAPPGPPAVREDPFDKYRVNVLVTNSGAQGAPVLEELNPTYYNLVGRIEYQPVLGTMSANFLTIKAGALHRANGGYLIVEAKDVLAHPFSWDALKRCLDSRQILIENMGETMSLVPTLTLRPDPIPLDAKVIVIGNPMLYGLLYNLDEDFRKLFKVKADFDVEMQRTRENVDIYAGFIRARVEQDDLLHFDRTAVAKVVEYGSRLLEHQDKLSTRFVNIADIVAEASYWAKRAGSPYVLAEHVDRAVEEKEFRSSLVRDKVHEVIQEKVVNITTEGAVTGQVNGLSVLFLGDYIFGTPSRITARVAPGSDGVLNVERETEMSGKIHSKGVLILGGYLAGKYAQDEPLCLSASLAFEQLYSEVDGDSASSAELYCLLSALADLPIRQDLAVTGSINQRGEVQAVGGVQYKIEGFFDVCRARGLTGTQGVIVPAANAKHMMLREDVVEAVQAGQFRIYGVTTIDEGIELLTGVPAGSRGPRGGYPRGSVNDRVQRRLRDFAGRIQAFGAAVAGSPEHGALHAGHHRGEGRDGTPEAAKRTPRHPRVKQPRPRG